MVKRFTDSAKFSDKWYRKLSIKEKIIWEFLISECNHAGILTNLDFELMSFKINAEISEDDLKKFDEKIIYINSQTIFIPNFIKFQYGILNPENRVHKSILKEFKKYKIDGASMGLVSPLLGAKDKDKDMDMEKDKSSSKEVEKFKNSEKPRLIGEYNNVCLTESQYSKLLGMCASGELLNELVNSFSVNIEVGKERPYIAELPNAHYERLKSYYTYRKRNPEHFRGQSSPSSSYDVASRWAEAEMRKNAN